MSIVHNINEFAWVSRAYNSREYQSKWHKSNLLWLMKTVQIVLFTQNEYLNSNKIGKFAFVFDAVQYSLCAYYTRTFHAIYSAICNWNGDFMLEAFRLQMFADRKIYHPISSTGK